MSQGAATAPTDSVWQATKTFFPLFVHQLNVTGARTVCVAGASDGKYVLPLARRGLHVIAIERDPLALEGGPVMLPGPTPGTMAGLRKRLAAEQLTHRARIVQADILDLAENIGPVDAV